MDINWKSDRITRKFIENHSDELSDIAAMTPAQLCEASTYCDDWENPFTKEIVSRAGSLRRYQEAHDKSERIKIIKSAAKSFNIQLF